MTGSSRFMTRTLNAIPQGEMVSQIMEAALLAVDPYAAVKHNISIVGSQLLIGSQSVDLPSKGRIFVVGAGKAGAPMAQAAADQLGSRLSAGIVIVKEGYGIADGTFPTGLKIVEASHPLPDQRGVNATAEIFDLLSTARPEDIVIALISGGASALLTTPVAGITLADLQELTGLLLRSGASISEINILRKHLDAVKGGGLARAAVPASLAALILSDVVGDDPGTIGSGPTAPDPSTYTDALNILQKYGLELSIPPGILTHIQRGINGEVPETLKPDDPILENVINLIVGSNGVAARAAASVATHFGFTTRVLTTSLEGEARLVGQIFGQAARDLAGSQTNLPRPCCLIAGGETTVQVSGSGYGGRNQEVALAAVPYLDGLHKVLFISMATDGGDGPTDAAGAVVSGETASRARELELDPHDYLARHDAYPFFAALGDLLKPGPTRTNVNDLVFLFAF